MTRISISTIVLSLWLSLAPRSGMSQEVSPSPATPQRMAPSAGDSVLAEVVAAIRKFYVFPEKRAGIVRHLEQAQRAGRYAVDQPGILAQRVTEDLLAASGDGHLYLRYEPAQYAAARATGRAGEGGGEDLATYWRREAIRAHHGLEELRVLEGNLRYLRISAFHWVRDETGNAYDAAMSFLKGGDAAIIDLRGNGGGSHAAVQYLASHFLEGDVLEMTFLQAGEPPIQSRTLEHLPAGRLTGKPLYVLIDGRVASAGEAFAYDVQQFKFGELVGSRTAGGANNNRLMPIAPAFMLSVSEGRPVHAVSRSNWEGTGVEPSVPAVAGRELEVAESLALSRLARNPTATAEQLADYAWASLSVQSRLHPVSLPVARLRAWAGRYGEIEILFRHGALSMLRKSRAAQRLVPLTRDGLFAVEGSGRLRVRFTDGGLETLWRGDPTPMRYRRS